jgi:hypothetical protein
MYRLAVQFVLSYSTNPGIDKLLSIFIWTLNINGAYWNNWQSETESGKPKGFIDCRHEKREREIKQKNERRRKRMNNKRGVDVRVESMCRLLSAGVVESCWLSPSQQQQLPNPTFIPLNITQTYAVCIPFTLLFLFLFRLGHPHDGHPAVHLHLNVIPYRGGGGGRKRKSSALALALAHVSGCPIESVAIVSC